MSQNEQGKGLDTLLWCYFKASFRRFLPYSLFVVTLLIACDRLWLNSITKNKGLNAMSWGLGDLNIGSLHRIFCTIDMIIILTIIFKCWVESILIMTLRESVYQIRRCCVISFFFYLRAKSLNPNYFYYNFQFPSIPYYCLCGVRKGLAAGNILETCITSYNTVQIPVTLLCGRCFTKCNVLDTLVRDYSLLSEALGIFFFCCFMFSVIRFYCLKCVAVTASWRPLDRQLWYSTFVLLKGRHILRYLYFFL